MGFEGQQTNELKCTFCKASEHDVELIIQAQDVEALICSDCVDLCNDILFNHRQSGKPEPRDSDKGSVRKGDDYISSECPFTDDELAWRAFSRVARILYEQWEEFRGGDTRLFDWLVSDAYTCVGRSVNGSEYREHLVPRALIRDICIELYDEGASIEYVAGVIRKLLKVAWISREEANYIDAELGLRTRMPDGWEYTSGDYMARLRAGKVSLATD